MKSLLKPLLLVSVFLMLSCSSKPTLQTYYINHQNEKNFVTIDLPMTIFYGSLDSLPKKERQALKSIEKANILALPLTGDNEEQFKKQVKKVEKILESDDYKLLMKLNYKGRNIQLRYLGDGGDIDEFAIFASDSTKGFVIARLLGNDMSPKKFMTIVKGAASGKVDINLGKLDSVSGILNKKGE